MSHITWGDKMNKMVQYVMHRKGVNTTKHYITLKKIHVKNHKIIIFWLFLLRFLLILLCNYDQSWTEPVCSYLQFDRAGP